MLGSESRTAGSNRAGHTGHMSSHHVRVSLDNDDLTVLGNLFLRQIQPIQQRGLLIQRSFGGIQVLRALLVFVVQTPGTKTNGCSRDIPDRPHDATAETINQTSLPTRRQTGLFNLFIGKTT